MARRVAVRNASVGQPIVALEARSELGSSRSEPKVPGIVADTPSGALSLRLTAQLRGGGERVVYRDGEFRLD
jgi:hypothetical protein